eukprot:3706000-Prymnesium_polylepis.1
MTSRSFAPTSEWTCACTCTCVDCEGCEAAVWPRCPARVATGDEYHDDRRTVDALGHLRVDVTLHLLLIEPAAQPVLLKLLLCVAHAFVVAPAEAVGPPCPVCALRALSTQVCVCLQQFSSVQFIQRTRDHTRDSAILSGAQT